VLTPFLPGDILLFMAGSYARRGCMNIWMVLIVFLAAALCGDNFNYWFGRLVGPGLFSREDARFLKKSNLDRTHAFFERYGGKTVIIARFVPIVRTFAPFVAGMGQMTYKKFMTYSIAGAGAWIGFFLAGGFIFAGSRWVKEHMPAATTVVLVISLIPGAVEVVKQARENKREKATALAAEDPAP
jgi:membrane-associated protein